MSNRHSVTQTINLLAANQPVVLSTQYATRKIEVKIRAAYGDTASGAKNAYLDYFANNLLLLKNILITVGDRQVVNMSGQMAAYHNFITTGRPNYSISSNTGTAAAVAINSWAAVGLDMTNTFSFYPVDSVVKDGPFTIQLTPFASAANVFSNAGGTIATLYADVTQVFEEFSGLANPGVQHAKKQLSMFTRTLSANSANQLIPFNLPLGNAVSRILLLGGSGASTYISPLEPSVGTLGLNMNEYTPFTTRSGIFIKEYNTADGMFKSDYNMTMPTATAHAKVSGLDGFYVYHTTNPRDGNQMYQYPVVNSANNNLIVDNSTQDQTVSASAVVYDMLVESYYDIPAKPGRK